MTTTAKTDKVVNSNIDSVTTATTLAAGGNPSSLKNGFLSSINDRVVKQPVFPYRAPKRELEIKFLERKRRLLQELRQLEQIQADLERVRSVPSCEFAGEFAVVAR
jgi:hypothetical protein